MRSIRLLTIIFVSFLLSCEQEKLIDYDVYFNNEGMIIIQGFISNKNGVAVQVNKSVPPNNREADNYLPDAKLKLFHNSEYLFDLIEINKGLFVSPSYFKPVVNEGYYINAFAPNLKEVISTIQVIKNPVNIDTAYIIEIADSIYSYNKLGDLFYIIDDPKNEPNYYYEKIYKYSKYFDPDSTFKTEKMFYPEQVFSDTSFNGRKETRWYEKKIYMDNIDSIKIELYSLSPDLYQYLVSMKEYEYTWGSPFVEQPSVVFSNIQNGYGIFGAYAVDSILIVIENE